MGRFFDTLRHFFSNMIASSSPGEDYINRLFIFFLILCAVILIIVFGMILTGITRFRAGKRQGEPDQTTGNRVIEVIWTVIPFIIVTIFFFLTIKYMKEIDKPVSKGEQPDIKIIAHQWWWEMQYPSAGFYTANELHIPSGHNLLMYLESADVIHDWWVPELGRKIDIIPGRTNTTWIYSRKPGEFLGSCAEYCGAQHAHMKILVVAQDKSDYDKWVISQQRAPLLPADSTGIWGARLFKDKTCIECHNITGISTNAHVGPDLTHISLRKTILSGMLPNTVQNLADWLRDPQKIKEGAHMPNFMLSPEEINALITYLEDLK
jgi:cytochrome c oxidase subunit 2